MIETYPERLEGLDKDSFEGKAFGGVPSLLKELGAIEAGSKREWRSRLAQGFVAEHDS